MAVEAAGVVGSEEDRAGVVFVHRDGKHFLSRTERWVRKRDRGRIPGIRRAWVHPSGFAMMGKPWAEEVGLVFPAKYDAILGYTEIVGNSVHPSELFT